jgi:hypothetical protein
MKQHLPVVHYLLAKGGCTTRGTEYVAERNYLWISDDEVQIIKRKKIEYVWTHWRIGIQDSFDPKMMAPRLSSTQVADSYSILRHFGAPPDFCQLFETLGRSLGWAKTPLPPALHARLRKEPPTEEEVCEALKRLKEVESAFGSPVLKKRWRVAREESARKELLVLPTPLQSIMLEYLSTEDASCVPLADMLSEVVIAEAGRIKAWADSNPDPGPSLKSGSIGVIAKLQRLFKIDSN